jgi:hypothetical protein
MKKALTLTMIVAAALACSVATATASYSSLDALKPSKHGAKPTKVTKVTKVSRPLGPKVIYIYSPGPAVAPTPLSPAEQCAANNDDLIEYGMDPVDCSTVDQQSSIDAQTSTDQQ